MSTIKVSGRVAAVLVGIWGTILAVAANADPLASPTSKPILTISGQITSTNSDNSAQFDRGMLEALGTVSFVTVTPWANAPEAFEGVPLDKLMDHVGATGERVTAIALNDYAVEIPISDFVKHGPILALKRNGEYMTVKNKGPLFIIYPFDSKPELKSQAYYSRSAWQVAKLVIK